ncbi:MAG: TIGR02996 domain-containing protein [Myxococcales bacterium]|nr:TIGR02996 domain-containing protein [Myxococcales bacterium]
MSGLADHVREAVRAHDEGRFEDALVALRAAFGLCPVPELADAVVAVSARCAPHAATPSGRLGRDRLATYVEIARRGRAVDLEALLPTLAAGNSRDALERLSALDGHPGDPRIGRALVSIFETLPFQGMTTVPFWRALFERLPRHADPDTARRLAALRGRSLERTGGAVTIAEVFEGLLTACVLEIDTALAHVAAPPDLAATLQALTSVPRARVAQRHDLAALLAAIYEHPWDDAPRLVYADALLEVGDPRGEFITLQFRRARGEAFDERREAALLTKHRKAWLGAVGPMLTKDSVVFEKGFVARGTFHVKSGRALAESLLAPEWATMRELRGTQYSPLPVAVVRAARALEVAKPVAMPEAIALFDEPSRLRELELSRWGTRLPGQGSVGFVIDEPAAARIGHGRGLPTLETLGFEQARPPAEHAWIFASPRGRSVRRLGFEVEGRGALAAFVAWLDDHCDRDIEVRLQPRHEADCHLTLRRAGTRWSRLSVVGPMRTLAAELEALPPDRLTHFEHDGDDPAVARALERHPRVTVGR